MLKKLITSGLLIIALGFAQQLAADTLILTGRQQIKGKLTAFKNGIFYFQTIGGEELRYPASRVKEYRPDEINKEKKELPKNIGETKRGPFSTPQATFNTYRTAAASGDLNTMSKCYIKEHQQLFFDSMKGFNSKRFKKEQRLIRETKFSLADPLIQGNRAFLKITRKRKGKERQDILSFFLEDDGWKIEPQ